MPFLKGRIGFTPMKVIGQTLPDAVTIEAKIVQRPYRPLGEKEASRLSFVTAGSTIPDQFVKSFENPIFRDFVVADALIESKKVDMAVVKARTEVEYEKALKMHKISGRPGLGGNKPDKKEIRSRIIEEELPKAPIVRKSIQVLFAPEANMIFIASSSASVIDVIVPYIKFVIFDFDPDEEGDENDQKGQFLIMNALTSNFVNKNERTKLSPFCFVEGQEQSPTESQDYMRELMTWLLIKSLDIDGSSKSLVQVDKSVRLRYSEQSELEQSQFKSRNDNIPIQIASLVATSEGGMVDEVSFFLDDVDVFDMGIRGCELKINKAGYISNIMPPKMKKKEYADLLPCVMQGVVKVSKEIEAMEHKFFELRKSLANWTREIVSMRAVASEYARDHLEYPLHFKGSFQEDVEEREPMATT